MTKEIPEEGTGFPAACYQDLRQRGSVTEKIRRHPSPEIMPGELLKLGQTEILGCRSDEVAGPDHVEVRKYGIGVTPTLSSVISDLSDQTTDPTK